MKKIKHIFLIVVLFCCQVIIGQETHQKKQVKILTFNILHGATTNGSFDLDKIASVIKKADADFVALQEVDFKTNRAKKYDLPTELGYRTKMTSVFARAMYYDGGEYGESVLSKYTFIATKNIALPHLQKDEPRAALKVTAVLKSGDTISFIGTHLDHLKKDASRLMQAKAINRVFATNKYPTILAGDLNDVPTSKTIGVLQKFWTPSYNKENTKLTFPSNKPIEKIDYVMTHPNHKWRVISRSTICDKIASDHCGYLVVLELLN